MRAVWFFASIGFTVLVALAGMGGRTLYLSWMSSDEQIRERAERKITLEIQNQLDQIEGKARAGQDVRLKAR
jgi:hypothetical protein